jgi:hypothetical protein
VGASPRQYAALLAYAGRKPVDWLPVAAPSAAELEQALADARRWPGSSASEFSGENTAP